MIAYVAGPYTAETLEAVAVNVAVAREVQAALIGDGFAVFCPHANYGGMDHVMNHRGAMERCFAHLELADLVVMLPRWETSAGACQEYGFALAKDIPIFEWPFDRARLKNVIKEGGDDDA